MTNLRQIELGELKERRSKNIEVLSAAQYEPGFPPKQLNKLQEWLDGILSQIPEEFREVAQIEFGMTMACPETQYASVWVSYLRPETDEEWEERKRAIKAKYEA